MVLTEACTSINGPRGLSARGTVTSNPTLAAGPLGRSVSSFDGTDDKVSIPVNQSIKSFAAWVYLATTTEEIADFDGGSHYIKVTSGTIAATGWTSPTIYVDGAATTTIAAAGWHHIAVTTGTAFTCTNLQLATDNTGFGQIRIGYVMLDSRAWTADEISAIHGGTTFNQHKTELALWLMDAVNAKDLSHAGNGYDATGTGLVAADDIVDGPYNGGNALQFNGTDEKLDCGDCGAAVRSIEMLVNPDTTTEELLLLDTGKDIMVSGGTVTYTGVTGSATYVDGVATTTLAAGKWQHLVCVLSAAVDANNVEVAYDGTNYGAISVAKMSLNSAALTNLQAADMALARKRQVA